MEARSSSGCTASKRSVLGVHGSCASARVGLVLPTQRPLDRLAVEQLCRMRPFAAGVHLAPGMHASRNQFESRADAAMPSQRIHQQPGGVTHALGQLDQAALRVVPGEEHDQPVLEQQGDQLGLHLTQDAPRGAGAPLIDASVRLPQFGEELHLPTFPQQHQRFLKAQPLGRDIGEQDSPICQSQGLLRHRLSAPLRIARALSRRR